MEDKLKTKPTRAQRGVDKVARIPIKVEAQARSSLPKPPWLKARAPTGPRVSEIKKILRKEGLNTVCEEASCPNLGECFSHGTATFMIMGDLCTRRCPFCDVAHGRPRPLDPSEPEHLANAVQRLALRYVVVTSVDRDDLRDGGAGHFAACIREIRKRLALTRIEILVPDFRGRMDRALDVLSETPPDVFNHNLETTPSLYPRVRPGSDYAWSLELLRRFKEQKSDTPTKSGLMLGLGESIDEVKTVLTDLRHNDCDMITLGQYLQPSRAHLPVARFVTPTEFEELREFGLSLGFSNVASGPLVRSSYYADRQAAGHGVT